MTDAAAIEWQRASPSTMASCSHPSSGHGSPSMSTWAGTMPSRRSARSMARIEARRILSRSISRTLAAPTATATARSRILTANFSRCSAVSTFESSSPRIGFAPIGNTTAAATTGPASGPRPTSSIPATILRPSHHNAASRFSDGRRCLTSASAPVRHRRSGP